jgi:septal ring factor EnvC (AmiA/AmiB activator)
MRTELAATKAELAATKAELAATKAELAATKAELADLSEAVRIRRGMRGALREVLGRNIRADMLRSQRKEI